MSTTTTTHSHHPTAPFVAGAAVAVVAAAGIALAATRDNTPPAQAPNPPAVTVVHPAPWEPTTAGGRVMDDHPG
jgi:hypothetical protein